MAHLRIKKRKTKNVRKKMQETVLQRSKPIWHIWSLQASRVRAGREGCLLLWEVSLCQIPSYNSGDGCSPLISTSEPISKNRLSSCAILKWPPSFWISLWFAVRLQFTDKAQSTRRVNSDALSILIKHLCWHLTCETAFVPVWFYSTSKKILSTFSASKGDCSVWVHLC